MAFTFSYISKVALLFLSSLVTIDNNNSVENMLMKGVAGGLLDFSLDDLAIEEDGESFLENGLCVPQDSLEDLELFPNFKDDSISLNSREERPRPCVAKDVHSEPITSFRVPTSKKLRSKRVSSRACSWKSIVPIDGESLRKEKENENVPKSATYCAKSNRLCSHCGAVSTPQWRMGPMGPKTLCNACGVRYKSGRLVPEYRPLMSPTFDSEHHSNSHKKILHMREALGDIN